MWLLPENNHPIYSGQFQELKGKVVKNIFIPEGMSFTEILFEDGSSYRVDAATIGGTYPEGIVSCISCPNDERTHGAPEEKQNQTEQRRGAPLGDAACSDLEK